ncbi:MAG TPA: hypothetical protein VHK00_02860, partial [Miltoncostaeaceae bacterium]|nr:hypothetical protein [Miltoncostaeaceae bacterium]
MLDMSMSLDGFITGPDDDPGQGLGRGGERLHAWRDRQGGVSGFRPSGASGAILESSGAWAETRFPCGVSRRVGSLATLSTPPERAASARRQPELRGSCRALAPGGPASAAARMG